MKLESFTITIIMIGIITIILDVDVVDVSVEEIEAVKLDADVDIKGFTKKCTKLIENNINKRGWDKSILISYNTNIMYSERVNHRFGNILRFPRAANEPPRAPLCGVSSRPFFPQESTYISYAPSVKCSSLTLII